VLGYSDRIYQALHYYRHQLYQLHHRKHYNPPIPVAENLKIVRKTSHCSCTSLIYYNFRKITTDYRHTRHDTRIQTELAFTLAKNATKPNSFEIIPLQTTRKENNWKTEEALARAAVTVETDRIKGSNP